MTGLIFPIYNR